MLSVMLYFSGSHMPQKGDYAPAYATFRCLCHILCSDFGVKYATRGDCATTAVLLCVSGLFTLVFGGDIVFFIYLTSSQSVSCVLLNASMHAGCMQSIRLCACFYKKCFETTRYRIKIGLCFG